jgi:sulfur carrier protein
MPPLPASASTATTHPSTMALTPQPTDNTVTVNGELWPLAVPQPLTDLLASQGLSLDRLVVEHNGVATTRSEARTLIVQPGDRLELVRIVAGG